jgi:hypothetical protein
MLIPFVIDSNSLAPDLEWSQQTQTACYNDFIEAWRDTGLLAVDGEKVDRSNLWKSINSVPIKYRSRIQELMGVCPVINIPNWNGSIDKKSLEKISAVAKFALVDNTTALAEFGLDFDDADEICNNEAQVTVCRLQLFRHAKAIQDFRILANIHIKKGDKYTDIWSKRFKNLAISPLKNISIVDRYAMSRHIMNGQSQLSGLERFIKLLNESAPNSRYITIYSAWTKDLEYFSIDKIEKELKDLQNKYSKRISKLEVYMAPNILFSSDAHDRFIRFHRNKSHQYLWELGEGLTVFEDTYSKVTSSATFKTGELQSSQEIEAIIRSYKDTKHRAALSR